MNYLAKGIESPKRIKLLISLTSIKSEQIIEGLIAIYSRGMETAAAAELSGVKQQNLAKAEKRLISVAETVEKIKEEDWNKFGYKSA